MNVKKILSGVAAANGSERVVFSDYVSEFSTSFRQKAVDKAQLLGIIIFTLIRGLKPDEDQSATSEKQSRQAENFTATGNLRTPTRKM